MSLANRLKGRRRFLKQLAGGSLGLLGFPSIVPAKALGLENSVLPNDRIRLGFIGMGAQGTYLIRAFLNEPGTQVLAVCDVDGQKKQRARNIAEEYYKDQNGSGSFRGIQEYKDYQEILACSDIDAVVTALPDHWHAIAAIEAAKAGKDIYCEKPLANSIRECRAMVHAARQFGQVFQTGSMQRSDDKFRFACELVRNGYIGEIQHVIANIGGPPQEDDLPAEPAPDYLDWDRWLGPAPWRPYSSVLSPPISFTGFPNWRNYWNYGGGGMTDWGAHHYDIAQWGLGMDASGPVEVIPPDSQDVKVLTYKYANGVVLTRQGGANGVLFTGTEGKVEVNRGYLRTWPDSLQRVRLKPDDLHLYVSRNHRADWLECLRMRRRPICDVEIGCRSAAVCHLGNIAYKLNRPLKWDPVTELFQDDPEANRVLGYSYRAPWSLG
jgi:predicted dehydrogenase